MSKIQGGDYTDIGNYKPNSQRSFAAAADTAPSAHPARGTYNLGTKGLPDGIPHCTPRIPYSHCRIAASASDNNCGDHPGLVA